MNKLLKRNNVLKDKTTLSSQEGVLKESIFQAQGGIISGKRSKKKR